MNRWFCGAGTRNRKWIDVQRRLSKWQCQSIDSVATAHRRNICSSLSDSVGIVRQKNRMAIAHQQTTVLDRQYAASIEQVRRVFILPFYYSFCCCCCCCWVGKHHNPFGDGDVDADCACIWFVFAAWCYLLSGLDITFVNLKPVPPKIQIQSWILNWCQDKSAVYNDLDPYLYFIHLVVYAPKENLIFKKNTNY